MASPHNGEIIMALGTTQTLQDSRYRVIQKITGNNANSRVVLLNVSSLLGWQQAFLGKVTICKVFWTFDSAPAGGVELIWHGTAAGGGDDVVAFIAGGTGGTYGYSSGQPSIPNNAPNTTTGASATVGDIVITSAAWKGTMVIEYHKVANAQGFGWSATGDTLGPPQSNMGG